MEHSSGRTAPPTGGQRKGRPFPPFPALPAPTDSDASADAETVGWQQAVATGAERAARLGRPVLVSVARAARADFDVFEHALAAVNANAAAAAIAADGGFFAAFENPAQRTARAAAGAVWNATFSGAERFRLAREAAATLFADAVFAGDARAAPRVFCSFNFEDDAAPAAPFAPALLFLPRLQIFRDGGTAFFTFNVRVAPGAPPEEIFASLCVASADAAAAWHGRTDRETARGATPQPADAIPAQTNELGGDWFGGGVARALEEIAAGRMEKVVLARSWRAPLAPDFHPRRALQTLRERHPRCTTFAFSNGVSAAAPDTGGTPACRQTKPVPLSPAVFLGATPELLLEIQGGTLRTEALAGTAARGATPAEDARLTDELLANAKELREHAAVVRAILDALRAHGIAAPRAARARAARFNGVQHLWTPITAALPARAHILDLARALHPTPALGGSPRPAALALIRALEPAPRGPYAGLVGWFDATGAGRLHVGIRAALIADGQSVFHAGAGIVAGAFPASELREAHRKSAAIREALVFR